MRSLAIIFKAHLIFYSSKEPSIARRVKELFHGMGFGNGILIKEKNFNFNKPLIIPKGTDSWDNMSIPMSTFEQVCN